MPDLFSFVSRDITLRPYQLEAIDEVEKAFKDHQSVLMVMATGLGKSVTGAEIMRRRRGRGMWVAHRMELVEQAEDTIGRITGASPQVEMADRTANLSGFQSSNIVVGTVQTLNARRRGRPRMARFAPEYYNTLITDEAHHAVAKSWHSVSEHFCATPELRHLGMTATPDRGDEEALGQIYSQCAYRYEIVDGINDGWLVPVYVQAIEVDSIDLRNVGTVAGDLNQGQLANAMEQEKAMHGVANPILEEAGDLRTLVFTSSVKHAHSLAEILNRHKPGRAAAVDGKTPKDERKRIMDQYRSGAIQYLCNVGIATEGFDMPDIQCVAIARPTMSRSLYAQMLGRGTRPITGLVDEFPSSDDRCSAIRDSRKQRLVVMDFVGNSGRHKLVGPADVLGGNYSMEILHAAGQMARKDGKPIDTLELLKRAENAWQKERREKAERDKRRGVRADVNYRKKTIDPFDALDLEPSKEYSNLNIKPLTVGQQGWLERCGFDTTELSDLEQRRILRELVRRKRKDLCTPKQAAVLKRYGYETRNLSMSDASARLDALARNNWKPI